MTRPEQPEQEAPRIFSAPSRVAVWWPLLAALAVLLVCCGGLWLRATRETGGHCPYTLDDAYIHMAMAKHVAAHGVWGVTPYEFSSTSSSPLWTLLLAGAFYLCGPREALPLILNLLSAAALLGLLHGVLRREGFRASQAALVLALAIVVVPLPPMVFCGLEHPFHLLLSTGLVYCGVQGLILTGPQERRRGLLIASCVLAALAVLTRYESAFIVMALPSCDAAGAQPLCWAARQRRRCWAMACGAPATAGRWCPRPSS